jgi:hypothetical protein
MVARAGKASRRRTANLALVLVLVLAASAALVYRIATNPLRSPPPAVPSARRLVQFDRFSARIERDDRGERLSVSLRLRTSAQQPLPCRTFVVARNDSVTPHVWSIWPPQPPGPAITAGGHFHGADPSAGFPITLNDDWQRMTATVSLSGGETFDTVVVYVLAPNGDVLLARPFRV